MVLWSHVKEFTTLKEVLIYVGLTALGAFILYRIVKSIVENIRRERFRKKNRATQFSGSAVKEGRGVWEIFFILISILPHEIFQRDDNNIIFQQGLSFTLEALGGTIQIDPFL